MQTQEERYLSRQEVAKILSISLPTLHALTQEGKIKHYKLGRRLIRYKQSDLESMFR